MSQDSNQSTQHQELPGAVADEPRARPWAWIPTLYLAEGFPYVIVMTVSTIMYTRLGASLSDIGFWTSILGFAWVVKPLWGPLVDLYWTKRRWTVLMQILMGIMLGITAMTLQGSWWWSGSLLALAAVALFSATHDIAADGFYMDALSERQQAFFVGIRSTFYRLAMIFGQGILLIIAGTIEQRSGADPVPIVIKATSDMTEMAAPAPVVKDDQFVRFEPASLVLKPGETTSVTVALTAPPTDTRTVTLGRESSSWLSSFLPLGPEQAVSLTDKEFEVLKFTSADWNVPKTVAFKVDESFEGTIQVPFRAASGNLPLTWGICVGGIGAVLLIFGIYHLLVLPKPIADGAGARGQSPFAVAALAMAMVVAVPVFIYWATFKGINMALSTIAHGIFGEKLPFAGGLLTFVTIAIIVALAYVVLRIRPVRAGLGEAFSGAARVTQVPFDEVFRSFFAKPGIVRMLTFLLVYRLGEALLVKMSGPFLVKPMAEGGMGLSTQQYGVAYGTFGIVAMTIGGILGGLVASRQGLKKWLLPMCVAINVPDLFYVYLAYVQPPEFWKVVACVAGESFGYGFGFTAYMLYMLYVAGTGEHKTSHFALCTGFMALGMMLPGMISGDLAEAFGWPVFFLIVCVATIPGFLMLPVIPLDREFGRRGR